MSSFNNTPNFDNPLLQTLMGRLQIRPPNSSQRPFVAKSLEDLLFDAVNNLSDDSDDDDDNAMDPSGGIDSSAKTQLRKEEAKLEKDIIRVILSGKTDSLKPNSGQAVTIGEHHICVGFHEEKGSDYRVWEWHGHIMLFDEENGYTPEYIYGNHFERLLGGGVSRGGGAVSRSHKEEEEDDEEEEGGEKEEERTANLGLRELIDGGDSSGARILHRNVVTGAKVCSLNTGTTHLLLSYCFCNSWL
ncbi:unnamed protein product [Linum tenue]|uniref:Uncharacterized protein n=1 Tax=Linum tenue TaxID=586396 RepID=A0AAV0PQR9_9ROSI|nr:unnamed protein product [Linum tenue]